jgi:putative tryptophan/tyrosine transport system substrate-binding protein
MSAGEDAVAEGFANSLSRPGGNITGIDSLVFDLDAKRLELLKEAFPAISRVAVLGNPNTEPTQFPVRMTALHDSARSLKVQAQVFEIRRAEDIAGAFDNMVRGRVDALLVRGDPQVLDPHRATIVALAAKHRLPAIYPWRFFVEAGGLMSYGTSLPGFHHRSATYVNRILKGAKPGDLSIESPTKFDLILNVAAAKAQDLVIPPSLLFRADELVQ